MTTGMSCRWHSDRRKRADACTWELASSTGSKNQFGDDQLGDGSGSDVSRSGAA
jgi:hypothetical protein